MSYFKEGNHLTKSIPLNPVPHPSHLTDPLVNALYMINCIHESATSLTMVHVSRKTEVLPVKMNVIFGAFRQILQSTWGDDYMNLWIGLVIRVWCKLTMAL